MELVHRQFGSCLKRFCERIGRTRPINWPGSGRRPLKSAPSLKAALSDTRPQIRFSAAVALAHIEVSATEAIPVLIEALKHLDDRELELGGVVSTLADFGPKAQAAIPVLIEMLKNGCDDVDVVKALVRIDPEGRECLPALNMALKRKEPEIVDAAARCLGLLGPRAKDAVPGLVKVVNRGFVQEHDLDIDPRVNAVKAIGRIGPTAKESIPALIEALKSDYSTATAAARVLGSFGSEARSAVPALIAAVQTEEPDDANDELRRVAILALSQIGPDARTAVPTLRHLADGKGQLPLYATESVIALCRLAPTVTSSLKNGSSSRSNLGRDCRPTRSRLRPGSGSDGAHQPRGRCCDQVFSSALIRCSRSLTPAMMICSIISRIGWTPSAVSVSQGRWQSLGPPSLKAPRPMGADVGPRGVREDPYSTRPVIRECRRSETMAVGHDGNGLETVRFEIARVAPGLAAERIGRLGEGMDSLAALVGGAVVFRFPKHAEAAMGIKREIALLPRLAPTLNLAIPKIEYIGKHSVTGLPFVGYGLIRGEPLHRPVLR